MAFKLSLFTQLFLLTLTAIPVTYFCEFLLKCMPNNKTSIAVIPIIGYIVLSSIVILSIWVVRLQTSGKKKKYDFSLYVFTVFAFTGILDFGMGLEFDGVLSSFMTQYFMNGEPYLNCSFGAFLAYYDGIVMYPLYLIMIYLITNQKSFRSVALYWSGTIINSMIVIFIAVFAGKHGIYPSTLLNIPYAVLPVVIGWKAWHNRPKQETKPIPYAKRDVPLFLRFADYGFLIYLIFAFTLAIIRAIAVIGTTLKFPNYYLSQIEPFLQYSDPAPFPKSQMLVYLFHFGPIYLLSLYGLMNPKNSPWMMDVTLIHAGAAANAQFTHIFTSIHNRTPSHLHPPLESGPRLVFWTVHLLLAIVPQLLLARCYKLSFISKNGPVTKGVKNRKRN